MKGVRYCTLRILGINISCGQNSFIDIHTVCTMHFLIFYNKNFLLKNNIYLRLLAIFATGVYLCKGLLSLLRLSISAMAVFLCDGCQSFEWLSIYFHFCLFL